MHVVAVANVHQTTRTHSDGSDRILRPEDANQAYIVVCCFSLVIMDAATLAKDIVCAKTINGT